MKLLNIAIHIVCVCVCVKPSVMFYFVICTTVPDLN